jgi:hypothetical protein
MPKVSARDGAYSRRTPLILGALLDAVAAALTNLPSIRLSKLPRMADFALWISAAEPALGWTPGAFMVYYTNNRQQSTDEILADSPLYEPLRRVLELHDGSSQGTASELLDALTAQVGEKIVKQQSWPTRPNALTNRLKGPSVACRWHYCRARPPGPHRQAHHQHGAKRKRPSPIVTIVTITGIPGRRR